MTRHVMYLHGLASSPRSSKARFFADRLAAHGITLHCPDLNEPDFSTLTITRMIRQVAGAVEQLPPGPLVLIGSSLGAFVAVQIAAELAHDAEHQAVRLVLLAPALELAWERWSGLGAGGIERWRATDRLEVFHYGYNEARALGFALCEDSKQYDAFALPLDVPMLIVQGRRDEAVAPAVAERFARAGPNRTLHLVDDDHQLMNSLELIWTGTAQALSL